MTAAITNSVVLMTGEKCKNN